MSLQYLNLQPNTNLFPSVEHRPFKAVVIIEQGATPEWQKEFSSWLVRCGCLFMMAWGDHCEAWHDAVDYANLEEFDYEDIPEDRFIMTTWHNDEPLHEVFWFSKFCALHAEVELQNTLLVHISKENKEHELLSIFENA